MISPADVEIDDIDELADVPMSVMCVTCNAENLPKVAALGERAKHVGMTTCANIIRGTRAS